MRSILFFLAASLVAGIAAASAAQSPPAAPPPVVVPTPPTQPLSAVVFKSDPRYKDLGPPGPYYPERAARLRAGGQVILDCSADAHGALSGCALVAERPPNLAFGAAAVAMAKSGWMKLAAPPDPAKLTAQGHVQVQVDFPAVGDVRLP